MAYRNLIYLRRIAQKKQVRTKFYWSIEIALQFEFIGKREAEIINKDIISSVNLYFSLFLSVKNKQNYLK